MRRLYDAAPVGLGYFDASLRSCYVNKWLASVIGLRIDQFQADFAARLIPILRHILKTGKSIFEWEYFAADNTGLLGSKRYSYSFYPDKDPEGKVVGISCVVLDVTNRNPEKEAIEERSSDPMTGDEDSLMHESALNLAMEFAKVAQAMMPLQGLAQNDTLTGLGNQGLFERQLQHLISISGRRNEEVASLVIGLDGFKEFGDLYGPAVSDDVLREVGVRLGDVLREADQKFRIVGSEFAVLLEPKAKALDGAVEVADKIARQLVSPMEIGGQRCALGVSIGIAVFPGHGRDAGVLFGKAVEAMYEAKKQHKVVLEASSVDPASEFSRSQSKVFRLIYVSTADEPISERTLIDMMREGRARSERLRITGMLLYRDGHFMHVLEGDETSVREILADAEADRLQRSVDVLRSGHFDDRGFPDWSMGFEGSDYASEPAFTRFLDPDFKPDYLDEDTVEAHAILLAFKGKSSGRPAS